MAPHPRSSVANRACDSCKRRKVKCDSAEPCSNCRISQLDCQFTIRPKKRGRKFNQPSAASLGESLPDIQTFSSQEPSSIPSPQDAQAVGYDAQDQGQQPQLSWDIPAAVAVAEPVASPPAYNDEGSAQAIWHNLLQLISQALPFQLTVDFANHCIDLFMQYIFPTAPIVHEPTLRKAALACFADPLSVPFQLRKDEDLIQEKRDFALITALCASVSSVMPKSLLPHGHRVAVPFLRASREMLKSYDEYDLEYPNSSSLIIRDLHYTALQHTTGKRGSAFHVMGEATLLARTLQLYDEQIVLRNDQVESQLLRSSFWHLYLSDQASVCLRTRPSVLYESVLDGKLTLLPDGELFTSLMDIESPWYNKIFEERLRFGAHLLARLWSSAAQIVVGMRAYNKSEDEKGFHANKLTTTYVDFIGIIDSLPNWLQVGNIISLSQDDDATSFQKKAFWVQRCTLTMSFHCSRLVILQQAIEVGLTDIMGVKNQSLFISLKKMEIIQDFLHTMEDIPFIYHQVKGEPSVERIRWVGTVLLEMVHNSEEDIKVRVSSYFTRLLDLLSKLNSKASEELNREPCTSFV